MELFCREFELDRGSIGADARLVRDLDFDSLQLLRTACFMEMLMPFDFPEDIDRDDITIGEIYSIYCDEVGRRVIEEKRLGL